MESMKPIYVVFGEKKIEGLYAELEKGKSEDKKLHEFISRAINDLKNNPSCGTKISKDLWSAEYVKKYEITNLWKYDLPNAWRLIYTIKIDDVMILNVILEWFDHKNYEKKFGY